MKRQLAQVAAFCGILFLFILIFFRHEIMAGFRKDVSLSTPVLIETGSMLPPSALTRIRGYRLLDLRESHAPVVDQMRAGPVKNGQVSVVFRLSSAQGPVNHPWLRVFLLNDAGASLRTVVLSPDQYEHASVAAGLTSEEVGFTMKLQPGESSYSVDAFYKKGMVR